MFYQLLLGTHINCCLVRTNYAPKVIQPSASLISSRSMPLWVVCRSCQGLLLLAKRLQHTRAGSGSVTPSLCLLSPSLSLPRLPRA
jgi:hypothetical protein